MSDKHKHHDNQSRPAEPEYGIDDNMEEAVDETQSQEEEEVIQAQVADIDALSRELEETKAALEKEKKEYLFLMAEFDNFRKRTVKEKGEIIKNASEKTLAGLLPIIDDFERGLDATRNSDNARDVFTGMELIYNKLVKYLEQNGVKPIESTGKPFDSDIMEAIANVPAADESQKGTVIDTTSKGYMLNDKVLRHPKVVVAQ